MSDKKKKEDRQNSALSRRHFLGLTAGATAVFNIVPRHVLGGAGYQAPSDMVNVAGIGVGAQGAGDIQNVCDPDNPVERPQRSRTGIPLTPEEIAAQEAERAARMAQMAQRSGQQQGGPPQQDQEEEEEPRRLANIYALCDVDSQYAGYFFKGYPKAKIYTDWREMLEKEPSIDAVVIATPDHNHAPIAAAFIKEKKHVYVEKPMVKTVYECRRLAELAKEYDVVTQMGNQGHASEGARRTVEWVQGGAIGLVREVHIWTDRPAGWWPQGDLERPEGVPVPDHLNWDVWLGPAPKKPYHPDLCHFVWRGLRDYGTGAMGDMGAHIFDAPVWSLNLGLPTKVQACSTPYSDEYWPLAEMVTYEFPSRGYMPPVKVVWFDGGLKAPRPSGLEDGRGVSSAVYYGDKGVMFSGNAQIPTLVPADEEFTGPDPWIPRTGDIFEDWIDAIKNGKKSSNDFSHAAKVTEIMLLTNVAVLTQRSNTTLEYDGVNMKVTNLPEANDLFHYEYRQGWTL
ncbi:Gfo/Idh/MocA family oxidoreductase [bacterium]|nr:Gfo/Idh/MocA family oxidoreductase [bacterium]